VILADVNVLVYAHHEECERHEEYRAWLEGVRSDGSAFGVSDVVRSGCLMILTHPRIFDPPTPASAADSWLMPAWRHPLA
jgi:uncharacterized protein